MFRRLQTERLIQNKYHKGTKSVAHRKRRKKERTKCHKDTKKCDILKEKRERNTMKIQKVWNTKREERKGKKGREQRRRERNREKDSFFGVVWLKTKKR